jgi:hypothetical protein
MEELASIYLEQATQLGYTGSEAGDMLERCRQGM